ncbi:DUF6328 family protein [Solihabitans fulvus]|uniref:DUF6328 family protein n=1 Tax=Solihabitans fulvus TaxID=1892852 RepID=UPI001661EE87|nr:DUF6328 family protein [Solihabitans fulvus]
MTSQQASASPESLEDWTFRLRPRDPHPSELPESTCHRCVGSDDVDRRNAQRRGETSMQRLDRVYAEILQEVRVAQTGVQILLAFLLTLAFTPRFTELTALQHNTYVATLVTSSAAVALLIAPGPFHRLVYRRGLKRQVVTAANRFALGGFALLLLAMGSAIFLILDIATNDQTASLGAVGMLIMFASFWYVCPLWIRSRHRHQDSLSEAAVDLSPRPESSDAAPSRPVRVPRARAAESSSR